MNLFFGSVFHFPATAVYYGDRVRRAVLYCSVQYLATEFLRNSALVVFMTV